MKPPSPVTEIRLKATHTSTFLYVHPVTCSICEAQFVFDWTGTNPMRGQFEGSIEEVDSGQERNFSRRASLLRFLGERFWRLPRKAGNDRERWPQQNGWQKVRLTPQC